MKDIADSLFDFVRLLESLKLPYAIMGGFAVRVYGIPRSTQDIDITVLTDDDVYAHGPRNLGCSISWTKP